mmetsp:Transcript_115352/g.333225  ORF Transcript_115352/g.333225 Transcript_115352/m.333225 type:complete len:244 (-) Transcript_115352:718-1449(-)
MQLEEKLRVSGILGVIEVQQVPTVHRVYQDRRKTPLLIAILRNVIVMHRGRAASDVDLPKQRDIFQRLPDVIDPDLTPQARIEDVPLPAGLQPPGCAKEVRIALLLFSDARAQGTHNVHDDPRPGTEIGRRLPANARSDRDRDAGRAEQFVALGLADEDHRLRRRLVALPGVPDDDFLVVRESAVVHDNCSHSPGHLAKLDLRCLAAPATPNEAPLARDAKQLYTALGKLCTCDVLGAQRVVP